MRALWAHPLGRTGLIILGFWALLALLADLLAGSWPIIARYEGRYRLPALEQHLVRWGWMRWPESMAALSGEQVPWEWALWPLVPYGPSSMDFAHAFASPLDPQVGLGLRRRHWLGTDQLGRDVLAAILHGARLSLAIGLLATVLAAVLGGLLGALAGFWGNEARLRRAHLLVGGLWGGWLLWAALHMGPYASGWTWAGVLLLWALSGAGALWALMRRVRWASRRVRLPLDSLVLRLLELELSVPRLLLALALLAVLPSGVGTVVLLVGLITWTSVARYLRAELLRVRALEYILAARSVGISEGRILWRHALPNALGPALVALSFGAANAILIESALSFLGLGVPAHVLTWGRLLAEARAASFAWWLAFFPGLCLFSVLFACVLLGEAWRDLLEPRLRARWEAMQTG
ncbi:MAG: ABC transporter permease [Bacteroidetes bacterium]|nr:ABC transporter permease [Rhodothermia bacterium]MCS7156034.1 ABC transporter permease [Bacteroidota bacterium]MCX7907722.1 ABC transporter permease [Bacteroidota bacterium]MDW8137851.1 ABC transporter permease [Bacteroidota bacterium]MDW8286298.1 ABC transporter permease [Bacteroidota bacterium]